MCVGQCLSVMAGALTTYLYSLTARKPFAYALLRLPSMQGPVALLTCQPLPVKSDQYIMSQLRVISVLLQ
jgi:hypothetical protein